MKGKGIGKAVVVIVIVAAAAVAAAGVYVAMSGEEDGEVISYSKFLQDFDENEGEFSSYNPGDSVKIQTTVTTTPNIPSGTMLLTSDDFDSEVLQVLSDNWSITPPLTLISTSADWEIEENFPIVLEGDQTGEYSPGDKLTTTVHVVEFKEGSISEWCKEIILYFYG